MNKENEMEEIKLKQEVGEKRRWKEMRKVTKGRRRREEEMEEYAKKKVMKQNHRLGV